MLIFDLFIKMQPGVPTFFCEVSTVSRLLLSALFSASRAWPENRARKTCIMIYHYVGIGNRIFVKFILKFSKADFRAAIYAAFMRNTS